MEKRANDKSQSIILLQQKDIDFLKSEVQDLKRETRDGFIAVNLKLDVISENFAKKGDVDKMFEARDEAIKDLQDNQRWVTRIIIGSVILALLGVVIISNQ